MQLLTTREVTSVTSELLRYEASDPEDPELIASVAGLIRSLSGQSRACGLPQPHLLGASRTFQFQSQ